MAKKVLSIEVGANITRICLTDYGVKNPKVYKYTKFETPKNVYREGQVQVTEELISLIKDAISRNKMNCKQVVFPITSSRIASREVVVPLVKENKLGAMIKANASDYFPIDLTQYEIGYVILDKDTAEKRYRLQVLAVPMVLLENYAQLAGACGLQMVAIDYSGNSIYQMVKDECGQGVMMVAKVDETATIVSVIKNGSIVLQRTINAGVDEAVKTIMKRKAFWATTYEEAMDMAFHNTCMKLSINARELMETEEQPADESAELRVAKQDVAASLEMLINGIAKVIDYYGSRTNGEAIDKIFITGIGSDLSGMSKLFTNELGVKTVNLRHLSGSTLERSFKDGRFGEYVACIGAVIAPVGFVNKAIKTKGGGAVKGDFLALGIIVCLGGIIVGAALYGVAFVDYAAEEARLAANNREMSELSEIRQVYADYVSTRAAHTEISTIYSITENQNEYLVEFIEEMEEKMPSTIVVTSMNSTVENVLMTIEVGTKEEMANAVQDLRGFDTISTIKVLGVTDEIDTDGFRTVTFTVECAYEPFERVTENEEVEE